MAERLRAMEGSEFVQKILSGERDFSKIDLEEGFDLCGYSGFDELQQYLKKDHIQSNPINIEGAKLRHLDADGLYLPYVRANGANLKHAALMGVNLEHAEFERADLRYVRFARANLRNSNLKDADLRLADLNLATLIETVLSGTNFEAANLEYANMQNAQLQGAKNLEWARHLSTVNFQFANITDKEKATIRTELWAQESKKRRLFGGSG